MTRMWEGRWAKGVFVAFVGDILAWGAWVTEDGQVEAGGWAKKGVAAL